MSRYASELTTMTWGGSSITNLLTVSGLGTSRGKVESKACGDTNSNKRPSKIKEYGSVKVTGYIGGGESALSNDGTIKSCVITISDGAASPTTDSYTFDGFVSELTFDNVAAVDDTPTWSATIELTSDIS
jgi:hypothetical protein